MHGYVGAESLNCYNIGHINKNGDTTAGILGHQDISNNNNGIDVTIVNSYYLQETAQKDIGNKDGTNRKTNKEFLTSTFVEIGNDEENVWTIYSDKNNGFPCIKEIE